MKSSAQKMQLASLDDLFSTQASRDEAQREKVQEIPLDNDVWKIVFRRQYSEWNIQNEIFRTIILRTIILRTIISRTMTAR